MCPCGTKKLPSGCETVKPTCKTQLQQGTRTSWHGCAKLWQCSKPIVQEFSPVHGRERDQLRCTIQSVASEGRCVMRISKYGLRGCRVGEASNPGSRVKRRRRVESSSQQSESDFSDLLDGLEEDLNMAPTDADPATTSQSCRPRCPPAWRFRSQHPQSPHHRELFMRCIEVDLSESLRC